MRVVVGGTFDHLHKGHKALISKAFEIGRKVLVGITCDEMIDKDVEPISMRRKALESYLSRFNDYEVLILEDVYGPAINDPKIDAIVVTKETGSRALEINRIREKKGLKPLSIIVVPMVLAEDGLPISSRRIRRGEIDIEGRLNR